ncbi:hypothetical protein M9H77_03849 [Catharanthus roseus]|uniref:Uncharacterized protein n=1 Tax=Catharanthus roseus TaxID=4058 RepID=A0ACC0CCI4_CATRO|nr:hypothetical protein M9H77_03849 [Catharanthus roseus]
MKAIQNDEEVEQILVKCREYSRLKKKDNAKSNLVLTDIFGKSSPFLVISCDRRVSRMEHQDSANPMDDMAYQENDIIGILEEGCPPRLGCGSRGRGHSSSRSSIESFIVQPTNECTDCEFPYFKEFPHFVYPLIDSFMDPIGDGNCGFMVVSYFMNVDVEKCAMVRKAM